MTRQPLCRIKSLPSVFNNSPSSPTFARAERLAEPRQRSRRAQSAAHSRAHADRDGVASHNRQQSPKAKTGEKSKNDKGQKGQKDQKDVKEWKASPIHELLPPEVCKQVHQVASPGGVVIEIQWSSSEYLPAHKGGQKYLQLATLLQKLLEGRLAKGGPLPVHILDEPIRCKRRICCGLYDTFSDWERDFTLVHSNRSYTAAAASRVGAFEVHLIGHWNPTLCPGELSGNEEHDGPAVYGSWGIRCFACAQRTGGPTDEKNKMRQQHTLLHSKLWTRRWPAIATLVGRIGALVIQPPPTILPVPLRHVPFKREQCPSLPSAFASRSMVTMLTVSDDLRPAILKDLASLLALKCSKCSCQDWHIAGGLGAGTQKPHETGAQTEADSDIFSACKCVHTLSFHQISSMLRSYHLFSASQLVNSWRDLRDAGWRGRRLDIFISRFVEVQHAADNEHRKLQEELVQKFLNLRESFMEKEKVLRDEYADEFERGQVEVEQIYVKFCLLLVAKIPEHGLDLSRLEEAEATASEAQEKLREAIELNKTREFNLSEWLSEVDSWKRDISEQDLEVWETIRKQRPDLDRWVAGQKEETAVLDTEIESCQEKMRQVTKQHDHQEIYQARINDLIEQFESQLAKFRQELGL